MGFPNKSDYRVVMDQRFLALNLRNPWRNPMKTGIVDPAYDSSETIAYKYGLKDGVMASSGQLPWTDLDDNFIGNNDGAALAVLAPWNVTPGTRSINKMYVRGEFLTNTYITETYVEVWKTSGSNYTRIAQSADLGNLVEDGTSRTWEADLSSSPLSVTIADDGEDYYVGVRLIRTDTNMGAPYIYLTADSDFTLNTLAFGISTLYGDGVNTDTIPQSSEQYLDIETPNAMLCAEIEYTSDRYLEQDITSNTTGKHLIARADNLDFFCKAEETVVADTNTLTFSFEIADGGGMTSSAQIAGELDCGDTTGGQNDLIYDGNTVNLPDIDPGDGSAGQEGKTFDLLFRFASGASNVDADLMWQNRHLEKEIHSHACKNDAAADGSRGQRYTATEPPDFVELGGTATIGKLRVGVKPLVLMGDSQCMSGSTSSLRSPNTDRWGGLPTALTKERMWIMHGQGGGTVADMRASIFANSTPGNGDGVELCGSGATWFVAAPGLNDISGCGSSYDNAREVTAQIVNDLSAMLESITNTGDNIVLAGLPPYSDWSPLADKYEAWAVRHLNRGYLGLALMLGVPFYNSWWDMVDQGTTNLTHAGSRLFQASRTEHFDLTNNLDPGTNDFWVSFWLRPLSLSDYQTPVHAGGLDVSGWCVLIRADGDLRFCIYPSGGSFNARDITANGSFVVGEWTHCVVNIDRNGTTTAWINNSEDATHWDVSGDAGDLSAQDGKIGSQAGTKKYYDGALSKVGWGTGLLTGDQVTELYNSGSGKKYSELSAALQAKVSNYWDCDESSGNLVDSSGNGNTGTDVNTVDTHSPPPQPAWEFASANTADGGTHLSAAGGATVRSNLVSAMENATIDLRDAWD